MKTLQKLNVLDTDAGSVGQLLVDRKEDQFVRERIADNVEGPAPEFDRERFWFVLLGCLMTTQQRSTTGSPVDRFLDFKKFSLTLTLCGNDVERTVRETLTAFGGIRMAPTIASRARLNHTWLEKSGWTEVQEWFQKLAAQRACPPQVSHTAREREAAHFAAEHLDGIGPKQSRNLWQWLGLTRYEIPLDSRVVGWINNKLTFEVDASKLSDDRYYEMVLDWLEEICGRAVVLPCVFDAAAFDNSNTLAKQRCGEGKTS